MIIGMSRVDLAKNFLNSINFNSMDFNFNTKTETNLNFLKLKF